MLFNLPQEIITNIFLFDNSYHKIYQKLLKEFHLKTPYWVYSIKNNNNEYIISTKFNINLNRIVSDKYISTDWLHYYKYTYPNYYGMNNVEVDIIYISDYSNSQPILK
jgi:hypothetical protein